VKKELSKLLETVHRDKILSKYDELEAKLGGIGASEKTAKLILNYLK
jgi:lipid-A-disaccharide synthase